MILLCHLRYIADSTRVVRDSSTRNELKNHFENANILTSLLRQSAAFFLPVDRTSKCTAIWFDFIRLHLHKQLYQFGNRFQLQLTVATLTYCIRKQATMHAPDNGAF